MKDGKTHHSPVVQSSFSENIFYFNKDKHSRDGSLYDKLIHKVSSRHINMHHYYSRILTNSSRSLRLKLMNELET